MTEQQPAFFDPETEEWFTIDEYGTQEWIDDPRIVAALEEQLDFGEGEAEYDPETLELAQEGQEALNWRRQYEAEVAEDEELVEQLNAHLAQQGLDRELTRAEAGRFLDKVAEGELPSVSEFTHDMSDPEQRAQLLEETMADLAAEEGGAEAED
jgi:hypothetical protein